MYGEHPPPVVLAGAGTSHYIGLSVVDLFRQQFCTSCTSKPTTRMTANPDLYLEGDRPSLMIHFARSGNSPESRAVLEAGLQRMGDQGRHLVAVLLECGVRLLHLRGGRQALRPHGGTRTLSCRSQ